MRLFGQLGISNLESTPEKDSELVSLLESEVIDETTENIIETNDDVDVDFQEINNQVNEIHKETSSFIFKNNLKANPSKEYSNETFKTSKSLEISEESLYAIKNVPSERQISLIKDLNIKMGNILLILYYYDTPLFQLRKKKLLH